MSWAILPGSMLLAPPPLLRLVLWLALLIPVVGFAQASKESSPAPPLVPATEDPSTPVPQGEVFPREQSEVDTETLFLVPRLVLQPPAGVVFSAVTGVASAIPLLLIILPLCKGSLSDGCPDEGWDYIFDAGVATSATFGAAVGVTAVGKLLRGRGRFWHTALGALLSAAVATSVALATDLEGAIIYAAMAGSSVGGTVAFAISDVYAPESTGPSRAGTSVSIMPMVSATRTGGLVGGLAGRF